MPSTMAEGRLCPRKRTFVPYLCVAGEAEDPPILLADWLADRLAGEPFVSEHWYVAGSGEVTKTPY